MARRKRSNNSSNKRNEQKSNPTGGQGNPVNVENKGKDETSETRDDKEGTNDPEWYLQDAPAMNAAANVPYSHPFGAPIDLVEGRVRFGSDTNVAHEFTDDAGANNVSVAGVCTVKTIPCFGDNRTQNDPLNVCANGLYSKVRNKNNGRKNYDPADLLMYALTFGDIYAFVIWVNRIYNYAYMYSQRNYFVGRDLMNANGVNHSNIVRNLANLRYWLNTYINKVSSFAVPADIYYFRRRVFMFGNVYIENGYGNLKDQLYQFAPAGFYHFQVNPTTSKGEMVLIPWGFGPGNLATLDDIIAFGEGLLNGITGDEDFGLMSGDILRAYEGNIIGLPSVGEDGGILPVYDPIVLSQFKNAQIVHIDWTAEYQFEPGESAEKFISGRLQQSDNGNIVSRYFVENDHWQSQLIAGSGKVISVENPTPGVGDTVEATRLQVAALGFQQLDAEPSGSEMRMYVQGGSDLPTAVTYLQYKADGSLEQMGFNSNVFVNFPNSNSDFQRELAIMQFKYSPIMYLAGLSGAAEPTKVGRFQVVSNLENYAIIGNDQLARIHDAACLSLFYVPGVAKLVS